MTNKGYNDFISNMKNERDFEKELNKIGILREHIDGEIKNEDGIFSVRLKNTFPDGNILFIFYQNKNISSAIFKNKDDELIFIKRTNSIEELKKWIYIVNLDKFYYNEDDRNVYKNGDKLYEIGFGLYSDNKDDVLVLRCYKNEETFYEYDEYDYEYDEYDIERRKQKWEDNGWDNIENDGSWHPAFDGEDYDSYVYGKSSQDDYDMMENYYSISFPSDYSLELKWESKNVYEEYPGTTYHLFKLKNIKYSDIKIISDIILIIKKDVFFMGEQVEGLDVPTFTHIGNNKFYKDKNYVYFLEGKKLEKVEGLDVGTFTHINYIPFYKDKSYVYIYKGKGLEKIDYIDSNSFGKLNTFYVKDNNSIYYSSSSLWEEFNKVEGVNLITDRLIGELYIIKNNFLYKIDKDKIYQIVKIDLETLNYQDGIIEDKYCIIKNGKITNLKGEKKISSKYNFYLNGNGIYYKNKGNYSWDIFYDYISEIDVNTFEIINEKYIKDKKNVYYIYNYGSRFLDLIDNADSNSFQIITEELTRDKNNIYYNGVKIEKGDPDSFEILYKDGNECFYKDKNNIYYKHYGSPKILEGLSSEGFDLLNSQYFKYKDHIYYFEHSGKYIEVDNVDFKSFKVYGNDFYEKYFGKDNKNIFVEGKKMKYVDYNTFIKYHSKDEDSYNEHDYQFEDKYCFYNFQGEIVEVKNGKNIDILDSIGFESELIGIKKNDKNIYYRLSKYDKGYKILEGVNPKNFIIIDEFNFGEKNNMYKLDRYGILMDSNGKVIL